MDQRSIELLNTLGFSHSYSFQEVQRYEYSVMADRSHQQNFNGFLQYIFDDADFHLNIHTIDGQYTFNGMGGIQCNTPASNTVSLGIIKRVLTPPKASVICSYAAVCIKTQPQPKAFSELAIEHPPPPPPHHQKMGTQQGGPGQGRIPFLHRERLLYHQM